MGEVVPPSEELLNLAVQGLLLLGESRAQFPIYEMSHDVHTNNDVQIKQTEREQLRGGTHGVGIPESDELAPSADALHGRTGRGTGSGLHHARGQRA